MRSLAAGWGDTEGGVDAALVPGVDEFARSQPEVEAADG